MKRKQIGTILIIVGAVLVAISALGLFQAFSNMRENSYLVFASGSMQPTLNYGDVVKVKLGVNACEIYAAPKSVNPPGDIIAFRKPVYPDDLIVHRAVAKDNEDGSCSFTTQGDANPAPDAWKVRESDIVGKVVEINPPFWTYNFVFWVIILGVGIVSVVVGVVVRQREPPKVGTVQEG